MKVFVVLACYNNEKYIDGCIGTLLESTYPVEIVVVENASKDKSLEKLQKYKPRITILEQQRNLGFGIGNNAGAKYAIEHGADWILWQNMDTTIEPDCIQHLVNAANELGTSAVLCPLSQTFSKILDLGFMVKSLGASPEKYGTRVFLTALYHHQPLQDYYKINQISGASIFISADTLQHVGGFCDLFYPAYYEDEELCQRLRYYGYHLYFVPGAVFYHDVEDRKPSALPYPVFICGETYCRALDPQLSFTQTYIQSILLHLLKSVLFFFCINRKRFKEESFACLMLVRMSFHVWKYRRMVLAKASFMLKDSLEYIPHLILRTKKGRK